VFIPLHDTNPLKRIRFQYVTVALIVINVAIFTIFETGWFFPLGRRTDERLDLRHRRLPDP
jgi:membrane associated rhomboid family serine protease